MSASRSFIYKSPKKEVYFPVYDYKGSLSNIKNNEVYFPVYDRPNHLILIKETFDFKYFKSKNQEIDKQIKYIIEKTIKKLNDYETEKWLKKKVFNISKAEQKLQQLLRLTGTFNIGYTSSDGYYNSLYTQKTANEIKKGIYEYLKAKKVKNLKKNRTGISYEYLHTVITCIINNYGDGRISITYIREIN